MIFGKKMIAIGVIATLTSVAATAQSGRPALGTALLQSQSTEVTEPVISGLGGTAVSQLSLMGVQSWDALDDADNIVLEFNIGAGNSMTGSSFDLGLDSNEAAGTFGGSWCGEAVIQFSNSDGSADPNAINLTPALGVDMVCDMEFSSAGVIDFSDNMLPDIVTNADGILRVQFFESFDDEDGIVDSDYRDAAVPAVVAGLGFACDDQAACDAAFAGGPDLPPPPVVPTLNSFGLMILALMLGLGTVLVMRRKA